MDKHAELLKLAQLRQKTRWEGYNCIGDYHGGAYECDWVSPYTKSAHDLDADVFVLLQDWASDEVLSRPLRLDIVEFGHDVKFPTNRNLKELLELTFGCDLSRVYATNLFPFVKPGDVSAPILERDLMRAAEVFALPQIDIVQPRLVVCLGLPTFQAMRLTGNLTKSHNLMDAICNPFRRGASRVWCQAHTGRFLYMNGGGKEGVRRDWQQMKESLDKPGSPSFSR